MEDEIIVAMALEQAVAAAGHEIFGTGAKVDQALSLLAMSRPDAALLDIRLADGELVYPVAEALTALGVPFALMTGYASDQIDERLVGTVVLHKPFAESAVAATINRLLDGRLERTA